jgi:hypothetical protein
VLAAIDNGVVALVFLAATEIDWTSAALIAHLPQATFR